MFYDDLQDMVHGKNIATSPFGNIQHMIDEWSSQETHFNYKYRMCATGQDCDAFLQASLYPPPTPNTPHGWGDKPCLKSLPWILFAWKVF